ncbi:hypothetical protein SAMN06264365_103466 [Actinoplanes regularis]|uniref:Uncharacterized protein n=1 Tax=Actinoplanes regularis TaxID=52697 RepID=A0A238XI89_9ACTN|nr:hypothetical protein SAMN06264365_103466 [Actinoplanes regularis]
MAGEAGSDYTYLRIIDASGQILANTLIVGTGAATVRATLPADGTYRIELDPAGSLVGGGDVTLSATTTVPVTIDGDPVRLANTRAGQVAQASFTGGRNQNVTASLAPEWVAGEAGSDYTYLRIINASGQIVANTLVVGTGAATVRATLPADGVYRVEFDPAASLVGGGDVTLSATTTVPVTIGGEPVRLANTRAGQVAQASFTGGRNQNVTASLAPEWVAGEAGSDYTYLRIINTSSQIVANTLIVGTGAATVRATLPADGTYRIELDPAGSLVGGGDVTLSATTTVPVTIGGEPVRLANTRAGQVAQASFTGGRNQNVTASLAPEWVAGEAGSDYTYLRIINTSSQIVANTLIVGTGAATVRATLPADGTYRIEFDPAGSLVGGGDVTLSSTSSR